MGRSLPARVLSKHMSKNDGIAEDGEIDGGDNAAETLPGTCARGCRFPGERRRAKVMMLGRGITCMRGGLRSTQG
jgi:hypothetical protein